MGPQSGQSMARPNDSTATSDSWGADACLPGPGGRSDAWQPVVILLSSTSMFRLDFAKDRTRRSARAPVLAAWLLLHACTTPPDEQRQQADALDATETTDSLDIASDAAADGGVLPDTSVSACEHTPLAVPVQTLQAPPSPPTGMGGPATWALTNGVKVARVVLNWGSPGNPGPVSRHVLQFQDGSDVVAFDEGWLSFAYVGNKVVVMEFEFGPEDGGGIWWKAYDAFAGSWTSSTQLQAKAFDPNDHQLAVYGACRSEDTWMMTGSELLFFGSSKGVGSLPIAAAEAGSYSFCAPNAEGFLVARTLASGGVRILRVDRAGTQGASVTLQGLGKLDGVGSDGSGRDVSLNAWRNEDSAAHDMRRWRVDMLTSAVEMDDLTLVRSPQLKRNSLGSQLAVMPDGTILTDAIAGAGLSRFAEDGSPLLPGTTSSTAAWTEEEPRAWAVDGLKVVLVGREQLWWTDAFGNLGCKASGPCATMDPRSCADGNPCTADGCDAAHGGCWNEPVPDGYICGDNGVCKGGFCQQ